MKVETKRDIRSRLEKATALRFLSLLFQSPTEQSLAEMGIICTELSPERRQLAQDLASYDLKDLEMEYHRVIGPAGIPACESSYDDNALAGRGPTISTIAGFYDAFAFKPDNVKYEVPDHISVELGFLSYLALKIAYAEYQGETESAGIALDAYEKFLDRHVGYWIVKFHALLAQSGSPVYVPASDWLIEETAIPTTA